MGINRRQFLSGVIAAGAAATITETAAADQLGTQAVGTGNWMSALPSTTTVDNLTIPGTHNTCAVVGGPFDTAKCQDLGLSEQLSSGVRFLDIRCRLFGGGFTIHHGPVYQNKNFTDVLRECRDFLTANPSETVIMSMQQEYSDASETEFAAMFNNRYMAGEGFDALLFRDNRIPNLAEARGKVVLIANSGQIGGIRAGDPNLTSYQNDWEAPTGRKWELIRAHLEGSDAEHPDSTRLFVNYTSTTTGELIPYPRGYARELNPKTHRFATDALAQGRRPVYGAVVMDFAGTEAPDLVSTLVRCNAGVELG